MSKMQLAALCGCVFVFNTGISSVFGLMPLYVSHIGADAGSSGMILAAAYVALASSTMIGGYLSNRLQRRTQVLIASGILAAPIAWWLGRINGAGALLLVTACLWFVAGLVLTMTNILAGLFADPATRGRSFGMLSLGSGLGLFFGSLVSGWIVDTWGFGALFSLLGLAYLAIPCLGLMLRDKPAATQRRTNTTQLRAVLANRTFRFLFIANIAGQASSVIIALGRPLIMQQLRFDATTITTAAAVGSLVSLPLPLLLGRLSDRIGRKPLIVLCFLTTPLGLLMLAAAAQLWQFWVAGLLQTTLGISMVVSSALVTDIFAEEWLGTALALLNSTIWIGIVIGLSTGSVAIKGIGMTPTLLVSALASLAAALLLAPITDLRRQHAETS